MNTNINKRTFCILFGILNVLFVYSQTWSGVGGGTNNYVEALKVYNNKLVVTGGNLFGITPINKVAAWDGIKWDSVGNGPTNGLPYAYEVYNNNLYAGGTFQYMDGLLNTYQVARWDGSNWQSAGSSNNDVGQIKAMETYNGNLYAGGNITKIGNVNVSRIAKWNGSNWSNVSGGVTGGFGLVYCMAVYNNQLYVGGDFSGAGGKTTYGIARWNGAVWDSVGCFGFNSIVTSMIVDTVKNVLYVGGPFTMVGNVSAKYVAQWNDTVWSSVGNPITSGALEMEMYHNELFVSCQSANGSYFDTIIGRWNGNNWYWVPGPNNTVFTMEVYNDTLYVGGAFSSPGSNIARYYAPYTNVIEESKTDPEYLGNCIPNPTSGVVNIPYYLPPGSKGSMIINNTEGKQINIYHLKEGNNNLEISLIGYKNGMYFYTLNIDDGRIVCHKKMILNK